MKCEQYDMLFAGWIKNEITAAEREQLDKHLAECSACSEELAGMQQMWDMMDVVETPEPSAQMQLNFNTMLHEFKEKESNRFSPVKIITQIRQWQLKWPMSFSLAIVLISFGGGYLFFHTVKGNDQDKQLTDLTAQVHELKQTMMLALLENPSASERIRGVSYTGEIKHADKEVIDALFATLNNDPNVNVRLSTLDALTNLAAHPEVREGLIHSISQQESPLLQSAIADVMLKLQEKRSVKSFKELLKQKNLDQGVRDKIKETITQLI